MPDLNLKSTTIEKGLDLLKDFLGKAIGPTVEELGGMWGDNMRVRRFGNALKCLEKAKAKAETAGVSIKQINLKALNPLLEGMSLEEDDSLQEIWANLFVNYIDSSKNLTMHVFPEMLKQLSTSEVKTIKYLSKFKNTYTSIDAVVAKESGEQAIMLGMREIPQEEMDNLVRLGLVDVQGVTSQTVEDFIGSRTSAYENDMYVLKEIGYALIEACER